MGIPMHFQYFLQHLLFADGQVLTQVIEDAAYMTRKLVEEYKKWELKINFKKTEYLTLKTEDDDVKLKTEQQEIHKVNKFKYLGSILEADGRNTAQTEKQ